MTRIVRLRPDRHRLVYPHPDADVPVPAALLGAIGSDTTVVTFRRTSGPAEQRPIHGGSRVPIGDSAVAMLFVQTDSRLAPLVFWDVFHACPLGARLFVAEDAGTTVLFQRAYYAPCLTLLRQEELGGHTLWTFEKTAESPVERARGLNDWSFGISAVQGAVEPLGACIAAIRRLGLRDPEILVTGAVPPGFRSCGPVRVLNDPALATAGPAAWRNALAAAATRPNLCMLDDRHILPVNLPERITGFGDLFPLVGLQTLYFLDRAGLHGQRCEDARTLDWLRPGLQEGWRPPASPAPVPTVPDTGRFGRFRPFKAHAGDWLDSQHLRGIVLCKTALWRLCPANVSMGWDEGADAEHGLRAMAVAGIPSRLLPRGFAQALTAGPAELGAQTFRNRSGLEAAVRRSTLRWLPGVMRKPLVPVDPAGHRRGLYAFAGTWVEAPYLDEIRYAISTTPLTARGHAFLGLLILARSAVRREAAVLDRFLDAWFAEVMRVPLPPFRKARIVANALATPSGEAFFDDVRTTNVLREQAALVPWASVFGQGWPSVFIHDDWMAALGRLVFAAWSKAFRRHEIFHDGSFLEMVRDLRASTPFASLAEQDSPA